MWLFPSEQDPDNTLLAEDLVSSQAHRPERRQPMGGLETSYHHGYHSNLSSHEPVFSSTKSTLGDSMRYSINDPHRPPGITAYIVLYGQSLI